MKSKVKNPSVEVDDADVAEWRARYDASIAAYERMAERRYERQMERRAKRREQAACDDWLRYEGELEKEHLEHLPPCDYISAYLHRRMAASFEFYHLMDWALSSAANTVFINPLARLLRMSMTATINGVEKRLYRLQNVPSRSSSSSSKAARERRKIHHRTTLSPEPTPDDFRKAWLGVKGSRRGIIAFGALVHDLECFVDNTLAIDDYGNIAGREPGILGWIREHVPELAARYKTIMRYKSIARRCRQYLNLKDPTPLDPNDGRLAALLADCPSTQKDILARLDTALADE